MCQVIKSLRHRLCWKTSCWFAPRHAPSTVSTKQGRRSSGLNGCHSLGAAPAGLERRGSHSWRPRLQRGRAALGRSEGTPSPTRRPRQKSACCCSAGNSPSFSRSAWKLHILLIAHPWSICNGNLSTYHLSVYPSIYPCLAVCHLSMDLFIYPCICRPSIHPSIHICLISLPIDTFSCLGIQLCLKLSSPVLGSSVYISSTSCGTYITISEYFMKRKMIVGDLAAFEYMIEK